MFAIRCPKCGALTNTKRSVLQAKVTCPACGKVFIGSSELVPDPMAASVGSAGAFAPWGQAASPTGPTSSARRPKRNWPLPWTVLVVGPGALAIVALLIGIGYVAKHPRVVTTQGEATRMSWQEPPQTDRPDAGPGAAPAEPQRPGHTASSIAVAEITVIPGATPESGHLTALVTNNRPQAIRSLKAGFALRKADGQWGRLLPVVVHYIPPGGTVRYSVEYGGLDRQDLTHVEGTVTDVQADEGLLCWNVEPGRVRRSVADGRVVLEGLVRNRTGQTAWHLAVYGDFYSAENVHVGSAQAELSRKTFLKDGEEGGFELAFDPTASGLPTQVITNHALRAIGRK